MAAFAVTFDLWETLIVDAPERDMVRNRMRYEGLHKALGDLGVQLPLEELRRGYEESATRLQAIWRRNEDVSTIEQIKMIIELASRQPGVIPPQLGSARLLEKAYDEDSLFAFPPKLNSDALRTLKGVRGRGRKIGLICNTGRSSGQSLRRLLENYGVMRFFDVAVFSNEVGYRKPDRRIYEQAAKRLGVNLEEVVHIGDDLEADVWGAKQAGMRAVLYEQTLPDLTRWEPNSVFVVARAGRHFSRSNVTPDRRIRSLTEALDFIDTLP